MSKVYRWPLRGIELKRNICKLRIMADGGSAAVGVSSMLACAELITTVPDGVR